MNNPIQSVIDAIYPVGSVYISLNSTMPSFLTTGRTWAAITGDYVLKTTTTETGGTYNNAGDTGSHVLTVDEIPEHKHTIYCGYGETSATGDAFRYQNWAASSRGWKDALIGNKGGGQGHTHTAGMPQNVAIYMWKRTA